MFIHVLQPTVGQFAQLSFQFFRDRHNTSLLRVKKGTWRTRSTKRLEIKDYNKEMSLRNRTINPIKLRGNQFRRRKNCVSYLSVEQNIYFWSSFGCKIQNFCDLQSLNSVGLDMFYLDFLPNTIGLTEKKSNQALSWKLNAWVLFVEVSKYQIKMALKPLFLQKR